MKAVAALLGFAGWTALNQSLVVLFRLYSVVAKGRVSAFFHSLYMHVSCVCMLIRATVCPWQKANDFPADKEHSGPEWYKRAIRAHANW